MHFSFCNEGLEVLPWPAACATIATAGYEGVEIAPYTFDPDVRRISPARRSEIAAAAREVGLRIVGLHWLLAKTEGLHLGHPEAGVRSKTRDYLRHLGDFCADLGGTIMVLGSPGQRGRVGDATDDDTWRWAVETVAGATDTLAERGVTLCPEALGSDETDFINTAAEARRLVEEVGHPNVRLMLDVKAMATEPRPIPDLIRENRALLRHVHANDTNRQGPGFGNVDFRPILRALREIDYEGFVSVEPFEFHPDPVAVARRCLEYLRACLPEA
jgi:D-psicose/D-tagatose/L-ribulose 3-epimerase